MCLLKILARTFDLTSTACIVGKPLKATLLLSVCTLGPDLRLRKPSPGVATLVVVLLSALLDGEDTLAQVHSSVGFLILVLRVGIHVTRLP